MRIRTNLSIMALVIVGSLIAAQMGKSAAEQGESVVKSNLDWHKKYNQSKANWVFILVVFVKVLSNQIGTEHNIPESIFFSLVILTLLYFKI